MLMDDLFLCLKGAMHWMHWPRVSAVIFSPWLVFLYPTNVHPETPSNRRTSEIVTIDTAVLTTVDAAANGTPVE